MIIDTLLTGIGATALLDVFSAARAWATGTPAPDYALVGRWLAHLTRGRLIHAAIARSAPVAGEAVIGWTAHYTIGIAFAAVLLVGFGAGWTREPALGPALIVGIGSVAAPFLIMQPGMGLGLFARRAPNPRAARLRSLTTHLIFGFALYASGWAVRLFDL
ncbi:MAG: DUF2938 domain-containing protein [Pseudolabrys sp.]|nr:DUF2938 domain-containing protein [Pseudolabrys sp.]